MCPLVPLPTRTTSTHPARPAYPRGWFAVAFSDELPPGAVLTRPFLGREVVVYRTASGRAQVVEPYGPHLGAHLGRGGRVEGERLRCPFHGFEFDRAGACVSTPYAGRPPRRGRLETLAAREALGVILAYNGPSSSARWPDPEPDDHEADGHLAHHTVVLRAHPEDTTENSVDEGHFGEVHGYSDLARTTPLRIDGPRLEVGYAFSRRLGPGLTLRPEIHIVAHGLGYSRVDVRLPRWGAKFTQLVLNTPVDEHRSQLRLGVHIARAQLARLPAPLRWLPRRPLAWALARLVLRGLVHDVGQDVPIWQSKIHVASPALAEGDGPIGRYRVWARQFYEVTP